ncbi:MAG: arylsulfatase [Opitutus sp.]|nr:arylsulfatase [Opitutus sp.]
MNSPRIFLVLLLWGALPATAQVSPARPPNFLIFLCDNLGYGDIGPYGNMVHRTPNLDRLATESRKFTHFYTAANVCTPSRAGLMTGTYPRRLNLHVNARGGGVLQPGEPIGLHPSETTIAEVLRTVGYATMLIGKWHLGDQPPFLPTRQGFDQYWGVPYSDDMTPREGQKWPPLPLMRNEVVIEEGVDRNELTKRETAEAIRFITDHRARPFFLIISHAMPGSTRAPFSSAAFRGKSRNGPHGDSVEELDWSAGEVLGAVRRLGLDDTTLVIWTADNPATRRDPPQGSNAPLSGYMNSPAEGGMRVPCLVRWPGRVPAATVCDELSTMMDLLPTFAFLAGATPPGPAVIDGKNIWPLFSGAPGARTPHEAFFYYHFEQLQAVRSGQWKLFLPLKRQWTAPNAAQQKTGPTAARLYDVVADPGELRDVVAAHPEVVARLMAFAEKARLEIGDLDVRGRAERPAGWVSNPQYQRVPAK